MINKAKIKEALELFNALLKGEDGDEKVLKQTAALCLGLIDNTKPMGTELFDAHARFGINIACEAVCLREEKGKIEVYLTRRSLEETAYPGQFHIPGSVLRSGEDFNDVFNRLAKKEFALKVKNYEFVGEVNNPSESRGHFISRVYLVQLEEGAGNGGWYALEKLPKNTIPLYPEVVIPIAATVFRLKGLLRKYDMEANNSGRRG